MRSPMSRGLADLMAIKKGSSLLVQCKRGGYENFARQMKLMDLAESVGAVALIAFRPSPKEIGYRIPSRTKRAIGTVWSPS